MSGITVWTFEGCIASCMLDKVQKGLMFTAFDITQEARSMAPNESVGHNRVKDYVHKSLDALGSVGYTRTSVVLRNGDRAFVYHHLSSDPNTYQIPVAALPAPDDSDIIDAEVEDDSTSATASFIAAVRGDI